MSKSAHKISNYISEISLQQAAQYPIAKQDFWASFATILSKYATINSSPNGCSIHFMTTRSYPMIMQSIEVQLACQWCHKARLSEGFESC